MTDIQVKIEIDPIVRVVCLATDCKNNLIRTSGLLCNLKNIWVDEIGNCKQFERWKPKE